MKTFYSLMKKVPLLAGVLALALAYAGIWFLDTPEDFCPAPVVLRLLLSGTVMVFLMLISGEKVLIASGKNVGKAFKYFIPMIVYSVIVGIITFSSNMISNHFVDNLPFFLFWGTLEMLSIGLFEELIFRAVINDAILYQFRNKKGVFVAIAIISSLIFGYVHVAGAPINSGIDLAQVVLKTLTTGLWGFIMLAIYWSTHNIWVCAIVHCIYDWNMAFMNNMFVENGGEVGGYVMNGALELGPYSIDLGLLAIGTYLVQMIPMIIILLFAIPVIKKTDFKQIREEW